MDKDQYNFIIKLSKTEFLINNNVCEHKFKLHKKNIIGSNAYWSYSAVERTATKDEVKVYYTSFKINAFWSI
jgi:hypothetical protein